MIRVLSCCVCVLAIIVQGCVAPIYTPSEEVYDYKISIDASCGSLSNKVLVCDNQYGIFEYELLWDAMGTDEPECYLITNDMIRNIEDLGVCVPDFARSVMRCGTWSDVDALYGDVQNIQQSTMKDLLKPRAEWMPIRLYGGKYGNSDKTIDALVKQWCGVRSINEDSLLFRHKIDFAILSYMVHRLSPSNRKMSVSCDTLFEKAWWDGGRLLLLWPVYTLLPNGYLLTISNNEGEVFAQVELHWEERLFQAGESQWSSVALKVLTRRLFELLRNGRSYSIQGKIWCSTQVGGSIRIQEE